MPNRKLNIIVVGGGIGGLTAAIALRHAGHKITVYEKASLSHEVGQGITISSNGGRILRDLGLDFEKARMVDFFGTNVVDAKSLKNLAPVSDFSNWGEKFGIRMKTAYRVNLHAALVELACSTDDKGEPVKIVTKAGVEAFDGDNGAVKFESGETAAADLIIAADGVKSTAAEYTNGADCGPLESSDTIVFRFTLPKEAILSDPVTKPLLDAGPGMCTYTSALG